MRHHTASFIVALKRSPETEGHAQLFIEGPESLNARNQDELYFKILRYFDDLERVKYLDHIVFSTMGVSTKDLPRWRAYVESAKCAIRDLRASFGESEDSLMGLRNIMQNLPSILRYASSDSIQVRRPFHAVVVAAGPSLDLEIERLKEVKDEVLVIAVDAVLRTLLKNGIEPHLVACTERGPETIPFFENLPSHLKTTLVAQGTVTSKLFEIYPGPKTVSFKFSSNFLWMPLKRQHHWIGGSVAHLCYRLATSLGAQSVALVGQDLAYHPETLQSHGQVMAYPGWSEGDTFENRREQFHASYVEGNWLKEVPSNPMWGAFAAEYAEMIADAKVPTFNTSRWGRKIIGASAMSFDDWLRRIAKASIQISVQNENPHRAGEEKAVAMKLDDARHQLRSLRDRIQGGDNPVELYSSLQAYPHFLELVMEVVFNDFVTAENGRWAGKSPMAEQEFLEKVALKLDSILAILDDARHQMTTLQV